MADERQPLLDWLDDGLRDGRRGRLAAEYGAVLDAVETTEVTMLVGTRFASHALARVVDGHSGGRAWRIGMIGLVYTDPAFRRQGLAARCIEAACAWLEAQRAELIALWSDRRAFYARLGFEPAGRERTLQLDAAICAEAARSFPAAPLVRPPEAADWGTLETLYAAKPAHCERSAGLLRSLASAPDCRLRVAGPVGRPSAYAARGRGDDFPGIVHEWAGEPGGVIACLRELVPGDGGLGLIAGPAEEAPCEALLEAGAAQYEGCVALVRPGVDTRERPGSVPTGFFLWGFDSI